MGKTVFSEELKTTIRNLNIEGLDDGEISRQLNMDRRAICYIRTKMKLNCVRNQYKPDSKGFDKKLKISEIELISTENKGTDKHPKYEVKCLNCNKIFLKGANTIGKSKCQCFKASKEAYNFEGHELISGLYFRSCTSGAEARGIDFNISIKDMWNQWVSQNGKCALSGIDLKIGRNLRNRKDFTASLDRIDSKLGYSINNIQWVHKDLNKMKMNFENSYFIEMCKLVAKNNKNE